MLLNQWKTPVAIRSKTDFPSTRQVQDLGHGQLDCDVVEQWFSGSSVYPKPLESLTNSLLGQISRASDSVLLGRSPKITISNTFSAMLTLWVLDQTLRTSVVEYG